MPQEQKELRNALFNVEVSEADVKRWTAWFPRLYYSRRVQNVDI